jgi:hypothetical protein
LNPVHDGSTANLERAELAHHMSEKPLIGT